MSKINTGLYLLLGALIATIGFSLYIGPVLANSSTATIIGGATNGNIFGSIQYDEMNITSAGVWRSDSGAGPSFFTVTYPGTLAWNNSWTHTGIVSAAASFTGIVNHNGNNISGVGQIVSSGDPANVINLPSTGVVIRTNNGAGVATNRLIFGEGTPATATVSVLSWDFGTNTVDNVGAAGNDFGATNTLVSSFFTGNVNATGFFRANEYYSGDNTQGMTGACAPATTLTIKDGLVTACA